MALAAVLMFSCSVMLATAARSRQRDERAWNRSRRALARDLEEYAKKRRDRSRSRDYRADAMPMSDDEAFPTKAWLQRWARQPSSSSSSSSSAAEPLLKASSSSSSAAEPLLKASSSSSSSSSPCLDCRKSGQCVCDDLSLGTTSLLSSSSSSASASTSSSVSASDVTEASRAFTVQRNATYPKSNRLVRLHLKVRGEDAEDNDMDVYLYGDMDNGQHKSLFDDVRVLLSDKKYWYTPPRFFKWDGHTTECATGYVGYWLNLKIDGNGSEVSMAHFDRPNHFFSADDVRLLANHGASLGSRSYMRHMMLPADISSITPTQDSLLIGNLPWELLDHTKDYDSDADDCTRVYVDS